MTFGSLGGLAQNVVENNLEISLRYKAGIKNKINIKMTTTIKNLKFI